MANNDDWQVVNKPEVNDWQHVPEGAVPSDAPQKFDENKVFQKLGFKDKEDYLNKLTTVMAPTKLGEWLGEGAKAIGLNKIPGKLMESAVGVSKDIPGLGDRLMNMKVWGTKSGMLKDIANRLPEQEAKIQAALPQVQSPVSTGPVSEAIQAVGSKYEPSVPGTPPVAANEAEISATKAAIKDAVQKPDLSAAQALDRARILSRKGYNQGEPLQRHSAKLAAAESSALRKGVKEAASNEGISDVSEGLANEQALLESQRSLGQPETLVDKLKSLVGRSGGAIAGAKAGALTGTPSGSILGGMVGAAASTPLGKSAAAYGLQGAGSAAQQSIDPLIKLLRLNQQQATQQPPSQSNDDWINTQ